MKKVNFFLVALLATVLLNAQNGVNINGVVWAETNVGATTPEGFGNYYTWDEAMTACPNGWRLPTADEIWSLFPEDKENFGWETLNGIECFYVSDVATGNKIFLPVAGRIDPFDADKFNEFITGNYWSSTEFGDHESSANLKGREDNAHDLFLAIWKNGGREFGLGGGYKGYGSSVRCVKE
jgi:uncharacterized protein (TIGR02145 family)